MATTENITVLFTDLVGSTELASSLAPEAADKVRQKHFSVLRQAIASSGGTEVKNLGDGLMVVFPAASAALVCAVAMQQGVLRDNAGAEKPLGLRVGLSSGEATKESDDYFGDPVIEAARLCAKAEGGQILVSDLVRANAGRRSSHTFTSLGELELKGLPVPIETLEVGWEPMSADAPGSGRVPLPVRMTHRPAVGVIGRASEFALLDGAAKRVAAGDGRELVLLAGEPGQGKTTLVSELARHVHSAGMTVLLGRCDEEVGAPYRLIQEAISHLVSHVDEELLRTHVASHGAELARMVPALGQRLGELPPLQSTDPDTERYLLFAAALGLLEQAAGEHPVLLVLEDLHWADKPSLQLLRHVVANTTGVRVLVLATYREGELSASHPLTEALAALHREPSGISTIDVKGLDDTGVIAFMEAAAGHRLDDAGVTLAHDLYHETDGNPYFVYEMLRHLTESGAIYQDAAGRWVAAGGDGGVALPGSIRAVIGARVGRLGDEAVAVLSTAAVIGREFDLDLLAETTGGDEDGLLDLLDSAQRAAVVQEVPDAPGRYGFRHALIQHALYEDLGGTRVALTHRKVGDALERLYPTQSEERIAELARHFLAATRPADTDKAIAYALRAGQAALSALAPDEAVRYFSEALVLVHSAPTDPLVRLDLEIGLGTAQRQTGQPEFRETLLEAAREAIRLGATERVVEAALANSRGFATLGLVDAEKVEVLEAALAASPETDSPKRARLLSTLCGELAYGPLERRLGLAQEAKAMARRLDDPATVVSVIAGCTMPLRIPSMLEQSLKESLDALDAAEHLRDPVARFWAAEHLSVDGTRAARFDLAHRGILVMEEEEQRLRQPVLTWTLAYAQAVQAMLLGELARAEELANAGLAVGMASGQPDAFTFYGAQLMIIRFMQGRLSELLSIIADVVIQSPGVPSLRAALALAKLQIGDEAEARLMVEEAASAAFSSNLDVTWLEFTITYAIICIELRLAGPAKQLLEMLTEYHHQVNHSGISSLGPVSLYLGGLAAVADRYDEAERYFEEAIEISTAGPSLKFYLAWSECLWGQMLLKRGRPEDRDHSHDLLLQVRDRAAAEGYGRIEDQATAALSGMD